MPHGKIASFFSLFIHYYKHFSSHCVANTYFEWVLDKKYNVLCICAKEKRTVLVEMNEKSDISCHAGRKIQWRVKKNKRKRILLGLIVSSQFQGNNLLSLTIDWFWFLL